MRDLDAETQPAAGVTHTAVDLPPRYEDFGLPADYDATVPA